MADESAGNLTDLLEAAAEGDVVARDQFVEAVYHELHRLARVMMNRERGVNTLQSTALVNEALLRLFGNQVIKANNRKHFLNVAARQMRRILIDHARDHGAAKRKGEKVNLDDMVGVLSLERGPELIALDDALRELAEVDSVAADVVE